MASIKGSQLLGLVKALRGMRDRATPALAPHLQHYLHERLTMAGWYPEEDARDLTLVLGTLLAPVVDGNVWRFIGQSGAERDFAGVYAALVRRGDTVWTLRQSPGGWRLFRDSGQLVVDTLRPGFAEMSLLDYPTLCAELAEVNAGYFEGLLRVSGAMRYRVEVNEIGPTLARYALSWS